MSNLLKALHACMQQVQYLQKDDTVGYGNNSYKGLTDEKVTKEVRQAFIKNGILALPVNIEETVTSSTVQRRDKEVIQYFTKVRLTLKVLHVESGESIEIIGIGHGIDSGDKGAGKATTYAKKYALLNALLIPTGEDADKTHSAEYEASPLPPKQAIATPDLNIPQLRYYYQEEMQQRCKELTEDATRQATLLSLLTHSKVLPNWPAIKGKLDTYIDKEPSLYASALCYFYMYKDKPKATDALKATTKAIKDGTAKNADNVLDTFKQSIKGK